jgi:DNA-binding LacI/PurR family transcriptional regulator
LLTLGHRHIAYISGPAHLKSAVRRRDAFMNTLQQYEASLHTLPTVIEGDLKMDGGRLAAAEVLRLQPRPTAIMAANDLMAIGALHELKSAGLQVPNDMSVIGFDDIAFATLAAPQLTTIAVPRAQIGKAAVQAILRTLNAADHQGQVFEIGTRLIVRGSTGAVKA